MVTPHLLSPACSESSPTLPGVAQPAQQTALSALLNPSKNRAYVLMKIQRGRAHSTPVGHSVAPLSNSTVFIGCLPHASTVPGAGRWQQIGPGLSCWGAEANRFTAQPGERSNKHVNTSFSDSVKCHRENKSCVRVEGLL